MSANGIWDLIRRLKGKKNCNCTILPFVIHHLSCCLLLNSTVKDRYSKSDNFFRLSEFLEFIRPGDFLASTENISTR